jgi:hypothetical protein
MGDRLNQRAKSEPGASKNGRQVRAASACAIELQGGPCCPLLSVLSVLSVRATRATRAEPGPCEPVRTRANPCDSAPAIRAVLVPSPCCPT